MKQPIIPQGYYDFCCYKTLKIRRLRWPWNINCFLILHNVSCMAYQQCVYKKMGFITDQPTIQCKAWARPSLQLSVVLSLQYPFFSQSSLDGRCWNLNFIFVGYLSFSNYFCRVSFSSSSLPSRDGNITHWSIIFQNRTDCNQLSESKFSSSFFFVFEAMFYGLCIGLCDWSQFKKLLYFLSSSAVQNLGHFI